MDISNRALGLLLVAAIVISIGGTVISLNKLDGFSTTGFATDTGNVDLTVATTLSIIVDDNSINFGTCTLPGGQSLMVDSNQGDSYLNNTAGCTGGSFPDYLVVRNNGNVNANVTLQSDQTGTAFLGTDSWLAYKAIEINNSCTGTVQTAYNNVTATAGQNVCTVLGFGLNAASMNVSVEAYLAPTAVSGGTMVLTFTGANA